MPRVVRGRGRKEENSNGLWSLEFQELHQGTEVGLWRQADMFERGEEEFVARDPTTVTGRCGGRGKGDTLARQPPDRPNSAQKLSNWNPQ